MTRRSHRLPTVVLPCAATVTVAGTGAAHSASHHTPAERHRTVVCDPPPPTPEQIAFVTKELGPDAVQAIESAAGHTMSATSPTAVVPAAVVAAVAWCARGAVQAVGIQAAKDLWDGRWSPGAIYLRDAVICCFTGGFNGVWKLLSPALRTKAVHAVVAFVIKYFPHG